MVNSTLHEWKVRQFYYNLEFLEDGSFNTFIKYGSFNIDEEGLGAILKVEREGIQNVLDYSHMKGFLVEAGKVPNLSTAAVSKKFLKEM